MFESASLRFDCKALYDGEMPALSNVLTVKDLIFNLTIVPKSKITALTLLQSNFFCSPTHPKTKPINRTNPRSERF